MTAGDSRKLRSAEHWVRSGTDMTGRLGDQTMEMNGEEVPSLPYRTSRAPLAPPCFLLVLIGLETKGLLDFQGRRGIASVVQWNLCPVIFGVDYF